MCVIWPLRLVTAISRCLIVTSGVAVASAILGCNDANRYAEPGAKKKTPAAIVIPGNQESKKSIIDVADDEEQRLAQIPLGTLSIKLSQDSIEEGENLDYRLTIHPAKVPELIMELRVPSARNETLGYRIRKLQPVLEEPKELLRSMDEVRKKGSLEAPMRFISEPGIAAEFPMLLYEKNPWEHGLFWLEPGTYEIQWMYRTWHHAQRVTCPAEKVIDFSKVLLSANFQLTIRTPPAENQEAVAAAKLFLETDPILNEGTKKFLDSYEKLLAQKLRPSLEKRVRLHAALRIWAKLSDRPDAQRVILQELEGLAKMKLTPGERELVHYSLARFHGELLGDSQKAAWWARGHSTPWAQPFQEWERRINRDKYQ